MLFEDERLVSFVDGMVTDQEDLTDEMYERAELHQEAGEWQMIFGVNTIPSCRHQGYAGRLLRQAIADAKERTQKGLQRALIPYTDLQMRCTHQIPYYAKFASIAAMRGYRNLCHWKCGLFGYQMRLRF